MTKDRFKIGKATVWWRDCILVPHEYPDGYFQLLITSTPYPGQAGFSIEHINDYLRWWYHRLSTWIPKLNRQTGVIVQVIKIKRTLHGWFEIRQLTDLPLLYQTLGLNMIDLYPWDKLNSPPSGNHDRHDRDEWEMVFALARSSDYTFNKYRETYATKTIGKAKPGNLMRQTDVRGSHAGGHSKLHPDGARQSNVLRYSSSGDQGRPRVKGGVFPRQLARRLIYTFSNPGDVIVDPFCGSGTSLAMGIELGRTVVGSDTKKLAVDTTLDWLREMEDGHG
jgi:site-specific DNA-methyltransferase (adenine-specific)/site-specific DNA-methyltransferase (cytosine-N4-specific)